MTSMDSLFPPGTDLSLMEGFRFHCRPDCGLCCFTTPAVGSDEAARIGRVAPGLPMVGAGPDHLRIGSRPGGGSCYALSATRCTVYPCRPQPCRSFPIHTHLGLRPQLSLVLSCPGVSLADTLKRIPPGPAPPGPEGLEDELTAVATALRSAPTPALLRRSTARLKSLSRMATRQGRWEDPETLQGELQSSLPRLGPFALHPPGVPGDQEPLENLPLFFEERIGVLGLREGPAGYQVLRFTEGGGVEQPWGEFPLPRDPPTLDEAAQDLLHRYLRYLLRRDHVWFLAYRMLSEERERTLRKVITSIIREAGAHVLTRAWVRSAMKGLPRHELVVSGLEDGIRAYDADLLDQPTLGSVL
jgi:hypothetical protein